MKPVYGYCVQKYLALASIIDICVNECLFCVFVCLYVMYPMLLTKPEFSKKHLGHNTNKHEQLNPDRVTIWNEIICSFTQK